MAADGTKVFAARPTVDQDGDESIRTERRGRVQWVVHTTPDAQAPDVLASTKVPAAGDVLKRYGFVTATYHETGTWSTVADLDTTIVVVGRTPRKVPETENLWLLDVVYEGVATNLDTTFPPRVSYPSVTYQTTTHQDVAGQVPTNSAGDAYEDGITKDANRRRVVMTRTVPLIDFDPIALDNYLHTRNSRPWQIAGPDGPLQKPQLDAFGEIIVEGGEIQFDPVTVPVGCAKISDIDYEPVKLRDATTVAGSLWGVHVTVTVDYDLAKFRNNVGEMEYVAWRDVRADMGYNELREVGITGAHPVMRLPIMIGGRQVAQPHLLNGAGIALKPAQYPPNLPAVADPGEDGVPAVNHDFFSTTKGTTLSVAAPGVLGNDFGADDTSAVVTGAVEVVAGTPDDEPGEVTLDGDGGFEYVPHADFVGYVWFRYKASNGNGDSASAYCLIYVGDTPRVRVFDRYPLADWESISSYLGDW